MSTLTTQASASADTSGRSAATGDHRVATAIRADAATIWSALTDGATSPDYYFGFVADITPEPGTAYRYTAGGRPVITGTVVEVEEQRRLGMTFTGSWADEIAELPSSRVTFTLTEPPMPTPGVTMLSVTHEGLPATGAADSLETGWVMILSGLKTLLETGQPLSDPAR